MKSAPSEHDSQLEKHQLKFSGLTALFFLHWLPLAVAATNNAIDGFGNKVVLDISPGPGNPRNSEGAFLELHDGKILFIYSRFEHSSHVVAAP